MKKCAWCKELKDESEFHQKKNPRYPHEKYYYICKICQKAYSKQYYESNREKLSISCREYRKNNKEKIKKYLIDSRERRKNYYEKNKEKISIKQRRRAYLKKVEAMSHYGGKCTCCGESQIDFLCLDHVNNDGNEHRKKIGTNSNQMHAWLKKNNYPNTIQILCFNCNMAKAFHGTCPHQTKQ